MSAALPHRLCYLVALMLAAAAPARAADDGCISDWSVAAPVVKAEGLASVETVTELARSNLKGDVVKVTLCRAGGVYTYRLVLRTPEGQHRTVTVDAKTPFGT